MSHPRVERSVWPHLWSWALCCATFPLLWVGGLITTTDAGMAVPDWPGTYGYNLFLYPWATWLYGPWDLFVEHGHRLLASGVGLLTIGLNLVVWRCDRRPWLRWLALAALGLVLFQGVLGGARVLANERALALAHGATGPLFFALTAVLVVLTSAPPVVEPAATRPPSRWLPGALCLLVYLQLVLGASMRHTPRDGSFHTFAQHVQAHLVQAAVVAIFVLVVVWETWRAGRRRGRLMLPGLMAGVVALQLALGVQTWILKYRLPGWANRELVRRTAEDPDDSWAAYLRPVTMESSTAGGWEETYTVTAHSSNGSLLFALSAAHAAGVWRRRRSHLAPRDGDPSPTPLSPTPSPPAA